MVTGDTGAALNADALPWWLLLPLAASAWLVLVVLLWRERSREIDRALAAIGTQGGEHSGPDRDEERKPTDEGEHKPDEQGSERFVSHAQRIRHTVTDPACRHYRHPRTAHEARVYDRMRGYGCDVCTGAPPHPAIGSVTDRLDRWKP